MASTRTYAARAESSGRWLVMRRWRADRPWHAGHWPARPGGTDMLHLGPVSSLGSLDLRPRVALFEGRGGADCFGVASLASGILRGAGWCGGLRGARRTARVRRRGAFAWGEAASTRTRWCSATWGRFAVLGGVAGLGVVGARLGSGGWHGLLCGWLRLRACVGCSAAWRASGGSAHGPGPEAGAVCFAGGCVYALALGARRRGGVLGARLGSGGGARFALGRLRLRGCVGCWAMWVGR
jgi:hypothetical protein